MHALLAAVQDAHAEAGVNLGGISAKPLKQKPFLRRRVQDARLYKGMTGVSASDAPCSIPRLTLWADLIHPA